MRRHEFVRAVSVAAGVTLGAFTLPDRVIAATLSATQRTAMVPIRIGYLGRVCEAASYGAPDSNAFRGAGLAAHLVRFDSERALLAALGRGSIDAASIALPALLGSLDAGADVRVVAGLHAGCLRVVSPDPIDVARLGDLHGKTIATDRLGGASMNLLSALLGVQGVDPHRDVTWRVYGPDALASALDAKTVACVAAADPLGYFLLSTNLAEPYIDTSSGGFTCGEDFAHGHHCFLAINGRLVERRPAAAAAITRAFVAVTRNVATHVGPEALRDTRGGYADANLTQTIGMLSSYLWNPSTEYVAEELEFAARDFQAVRLIGASTDPHDLAQRAYADVLHV